MPLAPKRKVADALRQASVNGATLSYSDVGTGAPLVCLHGGMGVDGRTLRVPGVLDLSTRGLRVIVPDQRGHGASSRGADSEYTHHTWASDVRALAEQLGLARFALLGHSYGGFLALEYAVRWPDSLTHLVLVSTSAGPVRASTATFATDAELGRHFRARWPLFFAGDDKQWPLFDGLDFSAAAYNAAFARELPAYDRRAQAEALNVPLLLVVGSQDAYRPHMEWLAARARLASLCVIQRVGHFPFLEAPDEFQSVVAAFVTRDFAIGPAIDDRPR